MDPWRRSRPTSTSSAKADKDSLKVAPVFPPLQGPASALPSAKQQRLSDLLRRYRADQISPQEYHDERAKILAEQ
jgi:hypothetical protein